MLLKGSRPRARGAQSLAKYIRENTRDLHEMVDIALDIARNVSKRESTRDRIQALQLLLNRALGKPDQHVIVDDVRDDGASVDVDRATPEQLAQLEALLLELGHGEKPGTDARVHEPAPQVH